MPRENQNEIDDELPSFKLTELFSLIPEYDGDQILLESFLSSCQAALHISNVEQKVLVIIHIKNKLRGKASQLVNSKFTNDWPEIKNLLISNFGETRNLSSLIHDLQYMKQGKDSAFTFVHKIQSHNAKLHSAINRQSELSENEKKSQAALIDNMCLDTLLTGLESKLGAIIRASNPETILDAAQRIRRENQLGYLENQRQNLRPTFNNKPQFQPPQSQNKNQKMCNYCKKPGHLINECRKRNFNNQSQFNPNQTFSNPTLTNQQNSQRYPQQNNSFQRFSNQPSTSNQNSNFQQNQNQRPSVIQRNPNFQRPNTNTNQNQNFQRQAHHLNEQLSEEMTGTFAHFPQTSQYQQQQDYQQQIDQISHHLQNL